MGNLNTTQPIPSGSSKKEEKEGKGAAAYPDETYKPSLAKKSEQIMKNKGKRDTLSEEKKKKDGPKSSLVSGGSVSDDMLFICKPEASCQGKGIFIVRKLDDMRV